MNSRQAHVLTRSRTTGFSLIELMVALAAGLIVATAIVAFMLSSFKSNAEYVQSTRLTQELRNTLDLAVRDLQRAGYDDNALIYLGNQNSSPFSPICIATSAAPTVCLGLGGGAGNCVIYAYDRTYPLGTTVASGTAGALDVSNGEVRGLRLATATINGNTVGVIEYAVSEGTTKPACDGDAVDYSTSPPDCNATSLWCPLSDTTKLDITGFTIADNGTSMADTSNTMGMRRLDLNLVGRIAGNTEFTRDVRSSVKVRSDCIRTTGSFSACGDSP